MPPVWDSVQYLRFEAERTRPCIDLISRIELDAPTRIVDLGCGPGTSSALLARRWPEAEVVGVDSSVEMLTAARRAHPSFRWVESDLRTWTPDRPVDLVFSNAALQWVPDHPREILRLWEEVAAGGALAFQVPVRGRPVPDWARVYAEVRARPYWHTRSGLPPDRSPVLEPGQYFDLLAGTARRIDLWDTEYSHVLPGPRSIVEWGRGTALRPFLESLESEDDRARFLREYLEELERVYPCHHHDAVIFPFLRRFLVAYR